MANMRLQTLQFSTNNYIESSYTENDKIIKSQKQSSGTANFFMSDEKFFDEFILILCCTKQRLHVQFLQVLVLLPPSTTTYYQPKYQRFGSFFVKNRPLNS